MGVDLRLAFSIDREIKKEEMRDITYRIAEAVGSGFFYLGKGKEDGTLAFSQKEYYKDNYVGDKSGYVYEYEGLSRYYGEGYERGHFPNIYMTILWLRLNFPKVTIYYGSDSYEEIDVLTISKQNKLLKHWASVGGIPYRQCGRMDYEKMCPLCQKEMSQYGFGGGGSYAAFNCLGCGWKQITRDKGVTWSDKDDLL